MSNYRIAWCRRWMARAHELEPLERADAAQRHPAVAEITAGKRLLIQAAPKDNQQVLKIESQTLKVSTEGAKIGDADHSSEIKLQWCWQRRSVALEMCELLSWQTSQKWLSTMFAVYASDPPANFSRVTLAQLIAADKALWTILARDVESVKPDANGNRPLDAAVESSCVIQGSQCTCCQCQTKHLQRLRQPHRLDSHQVVRQATLGSDQRRKHAQAKEIDQPRRRLRSSSHVINRPLTESQLAGHTIWAMVAV